MRMPWSPIPIPEAYMERLMAISRNVSAVPWCGHRADDDLICVAPPGHHGPHGWVAIELVVAPTLSPPTALDIPISDQGFVGVVPLSMDVDWDPWNGPVITETQWAEQNRRACAILHRGA